MTLQIASNQIAIMKPATVAPGPVTRRGVRSRLPA
jgi:hypothetical protein